MTEREFTLTETSNPGWITGQLATLGAAVGALIAAHPDRNRLLREIDQALEPLIAMALGSHAPDGLHEGIAAAKALYVAPPAA